MNAGDMLYFWGEDMPLMVVMANETGVRVYDVKSPEFTNDGCVITKYFSYEELNEVCSYMGNVETMIQSKVIQYQIEDTWGSD